MLGKLFPNFVIWHIGHESFNFSFYCSTAFKHPYLNLALQCLGQSKEQECPLDVQAHSVRRDQCPDKCTNNTSGYRYCLLKQRK